jgi:hypothetical protein
LTILRGPVQGHDSRQTMAGNAVEDSAADVEAGRYWDRKDVRMTRDAAYLHLNVPIAHSASLELPRAAYLANHDLFPIALESPESQLQ